LPSVPRPDTDSAHSASTTSFDDVQERDAEQVAAAAQAASSVPRDQSQYTIPLVFNPNLTTESDGFSNNLTISIASTRTSRILSGDEHVAWGGRGQAWSDLVLISPGGLELTPEVPETSLEMIEGSEGPGLAHSEETPRELATKGADLLAPYLPIDRASLEQVIDRLIDGIEILGGDPASDVESAEIIPLPIAWGIGLAAMELIRRRLRPKGESEGGDQPDHDPALGLGGTSP
jgi:hypothetical protein